VTCLARGLWLGFLLGLPQLQFLPYDYAHQQIHHYCQQSFRSADLQPTDSWECGHYPALDAHPGHMFLSDHTTSGLEIVVADGYDPNIVKMACFKTCDSDCRFLTR